MLKLPLFSIWTHLTLSLATINILQILQSALQTLGYPAVVLFVMIDSAGIPFPGETMLILAAFYAAVDQHLQIPFVIGCAALGAIVGDNIGFYIGRTGGRAFIERYGHYIFLKPEHLERAQKFFEKHGDKTVFFGRFVAILRAWAAFMAGVNQMRWRTFLVYNAAGAILWATIFGLLGFYAGRFFHDNFSQVEALTRNISWILGGIIVLAAITIAIIVIYQRRKSNQAAKDKKSGS
jgi:membrane protein DedA with SNARE-associated domain